ncbi:S9 family peptidase [Actinomycetaceae bacterium L2_0104]
MSITRAPIARKVPAERHVHGDVYVDNYEWLRDKENPELIAHLEAENAWTRERTKHLDTLQERLVTEIASLTKQSDTTIPWREGDWWYYQRTWEGKQYPAMFRVPAQGEDRPDLSSPVAEQCVWDGNVLSDGEEFFSSSGFSPSPDGSLGALGVDYSGDEHFRLRIFEIETGYVVDEVVDGLAYGMAWTADSENIAYARVDDSWRSWQIWLHAVGTPASDDVLLFQEDDDRFDVWPTASRDGKWIVVTSASRSTTEVRLFATAQPHAEPIVVCWRQQGLDYLVEPADDQLLILHNRENPDFAVATAPIRTATPEEWVPLVVPGPGERIYDIDAFQDFAVISMRSGGETQLRLISRTNRPPVELRKETNGYQEPHERAIWGEPQAIPSEPLSTIELYPSPYWNAQEVVFTTESLLTPPTQTMYGVASGQSTVLKTLEVPGYDRSQFVQEGVWVEAEDGTSVPLTIAYKAGTAPDGTNPGWIYGYGSYEVPNDPYFAARHIVLLERGVVIAWTHVRGGGEMGRSWYEEGRLLSKKNTFSDFVDCARWLHSSGWVAPDRLAAEGRSAGGLLMGAVVNMAPELFRAVHAGVPFVDALTTILNPDLPLTAGEWEEWGNPIESPEVYEYMKSYSPAENIREVEYPAILATTSLNDIRVLYVEPTKWVQLLREKALNDPLERPILERIEMVAGHAGKTGRYDKWRTQAFVLAWLLEQIGVE